MSNKQNKTPSEIALAKLVNGVFPELFTNVIGQKGPLTRIEHYLRSYIRTRNLPHLLFVSQKGNGKTMLARQTAKGLLKFDDNREAELVNATQLPRIKNFIEINCSALPKNASDFINDWMVPYVQDKDVTLFFDEASEIPIDIQMALLTILELNQLKTQYAIGQYACQFDFTRQTFIFATSEPQKIFHALLDRLKRGRIDLEEYTPAELACIVQKGSHAVNYEKGVLDSIASVSRGNARNAISYAEEVKTYLGCDNGVFQFYDWKKLRGILSIAPLGLNITELNIMRHLQSCPNGVSLTALSAKMGMSRESVQRDGELYLLKHSLIGIQPAIGRVLTNKGKEYLATFSM